MCSLGDDEIEIESPKQASVPEQLSFNINERKCKKCRDQQPRIVLRGKDVYCKACFLQGVLHKFKAVLGKHRFLSNKDRVLVIYKSGHPSTALLHFMHTGLSCSTPKKIQVEPIILYIECHDDLPVDERRQILEKVYLQVKSFNFASCFASLTKYILKEDYFVDDFNLVQLGGNDRSKIMSIVSPGASQTVKEEALVIFTRQLIIDVAKHMKCKCIFTPELAVDVATQMLADISLGRGAQLPLNTGVCDSRDPLVKIIKPLRLHDMKELALYNVFNNLTPLVFHQIAKNRCSSVQSLMKEFIHSLQVNYPSTVNTIVRTGDKLSIQEDSSNTGKCSLCQASIESNSKELTSAEATNFSHWLSTQKLNQDIPSVERYKRSIASFDGLNNPQYCFACSKIESYLIKH